SAQTTPCASTPPRRSPPTARRRARRDQRPPGRRCGPPRTVGPGPPGPRRPAGQEHPLGAAQEPARWTDQQRQTITQLRRARHVLFRAWVLKEELRDLYRLPPGRRPDAPPA